MTVTFNSVLIADGESRTCKVASGLAPSGELAYEALEFLRAEWATPVARGNRIITLPMVIEMPQSADFGTALVSALMYFANLSQEGELVITEGSNQVTFTNAVCVQCKIVDEIMGISYAVALRFVCDMPAPATLSTLALMDKRSVANLYSVTGLTGGGSTSLDGLTTTDVGEGFTAFLTPTIGGVAQPKHFRLTAGTDVTNTDPSAGALIVRPADYTSSLPKVWKEL